MIIVLGVAAIVVILAAAVIVVAIQITFPKKAEQQHEHQRSPDIDVHNVV